MYIRQGNEEYDSITFNANVEMLSERTQTMVTVKGRFWEKLDDVNTMEVEIPAVKTP